MKLNQKLQFKHKYIDVIQLCNIDIANTKCSFVQTLYLIKLSIVRNQPELARLFR